MIYLSACGSIQQLPYNPATSLDNRHPQKNRSVDDLSTPLLSLICSYLQPEQEAQQSAEEQQFDCAAPVPAIPSAITTSNSIRFNVFIVFSLEGKSCR
jgi:hypothetical protein